MEEFIVDNICKFVEFDSRNEDEIQIAHFVYETKIALHKKENVTLYKMNIVAKGTATVLINGREFLLKKGDVFFLLPAFEFEIVKSDEFEYTYISYFGLKANYLMDKLAIGINNCIFTGKEDLLNFWKISITDKTADFSDIFVKGILLYSLSRIENRNLKNDGFKMKNDWIKGVKQYIDNNFSDPDLSLRKINEKCYYSVKYMTKVFKRNYNLSIADYLRTIRLQKAFELLNESTLSIKEIAHECGFNDQLYFSKVFKAVYTKSPSECRSEINAISKKSL